VAASLGIGPGHLVCYCRDKAKVEPAATWSWQRARGPWCRSSARSSACPGCRRRRRRSA